MPISLLQRNAGGSTELPAPQTAVRENTVSVCKKYLCSSLVETHDQLLENKHAEEPTTDDEIRQRIRYIVWCQQSLFHYKSHLSTDYKTTRAFIFTSFLILPLIDLIISSFCVLLVEILYRTICLISIITVTQINGINAHAYKTS